MAARAADYEAAAQPPDSALLHSDYASGAACLPGREGCPLNCECSYPSIRIQPHPQPVENQKKEFGWQPGPTTGRFGCRCPGRLCGHQCRRVRPAGGIARRKDTDGARCLLRINPGRQVVGLRGRMEHLQSILVHVRVGDIQFHAQAFPQGIGALDYYIQCVDAVNGDVPLCNHLCTSVVEIYTDNNVQLGIQVVKPSPALAATLQLLAMACFLSLNQSRCKM